MDERYVVLLYKADTFTRNLRSSNEGEVFWLEKNELFSIQTAPDFLEMYKIFASPELSEFYYERYDENWKMKIL